MVAVIEGQPSQQVSQTLYFMAESTSCLIGFSRDVTYTYGIMQKVFDKITAYTTKNNWSGYLPTNQFVLIIARECHISNLKASSGFATMSWLGHWWLYGFRLCFTGYFRALCLSVLEQSPNHRADTRFAPSQWETVLLCNDATHCLGASLESALQSYDLVSRLLRPCSAMITGPRRPSY